MSGGYEKAPLHSYGRGLFHMETSQEASELLQRLDLINTLRT